MENKRHWWQNQPLIISAVQYCEDDSNWILDSYVSEYGFNTEQLFHIYGSHDSSIVNYDEERDEENLKSYLKKARERGLREIVYYNTHVLEKQISAKHPEWVQKTKDGSDVIFYDLYRAICPNPNGSFHKDMLKRIEDLSNMGIDGVFMDGPIMRDCYCDVCRRTFEERFGHSMDEGTRLELQTMRTELVTQHVKEIYETIKKVNPEILLYLNNSALRPDVTGSNTREVYDYVDLLGAEGGFHPAQMGANGIWHLSARAKQLEGVVGDTLKGDKPIVCFFNGNHGGIAHYLHTPAETRLAYAQSFANGSNIWYGVHHSAKEFYDTKSCLAAQEMNQFVQEHKEVFGPSKVCARIALVWSQCTANNYASSIEDSDFVGAQKTGFYDRGDHYAAFISIYDMLARNHIQFDVIDEKSIEEGIISKYDSLILPGVACLSDEVAQTIAAYVKEGGNILANYDVGCYNEEGSYCGSSKLSEVFGFVGTPELMKSPMIASAYLYKEKEDAMLDVDFISKFRIPAPMLNLKWNYADDVEVLMQATRPKSTSYENIPEEGKYPAMVKHKYGEGTAYYISGNFAETVLEQRNITDYAKMVRRYCDLTSTPTVISDSAGLYEVVLRRQENRFVLHIVNITGAMERPIERIVPLHNVEFQLNLEGYGIEKAEYCLTSLRGAKIDNLKVTGNQISFNLDKIKEYEILVIE